jgi:hypothetical protein
MATAGAVRGPAFLGHDTFESQPGGGFQERLPILKALGTADMDAIGATQHIGQPRLTLLKRQSTQVTFSEPQQIESPKCVQVISISALKRLEVGNALMIQRSDFSIQDDVADGQPGNADQIWEAKAKIIPAF